MKIKIILVIFLINGYLSFSQNNMDELYYDEKKSAVSGDVFNDWRGLYCYFEIGETSYGNDMVHSWNYTVEIYETEGEMYATIEVNGRFAGINVIAKIVEDNNSIRFIFDRYPDTETYYDYPFWTKEDWIKDGWTEEDREIPETLLLTFTMVNDELITTWGAISPMTSETNNDLSGIYFVKR